MEAILHLVGEKVEDAVVAALVAGAGLDHIRGVECKINAAMMMRINLTPGYYHRILLQRMLELTCHYMVLGLFVVMVQAWRCHRRVPWGKRQPRRRWMLILNLIRTVAAI